MATITLSRHSSNPLDRGSSDNAASKINMSLFKNSRHPLSSDDPLSLGGGPDPQMQEFIEHIEKAHPAAGASMKRQSFGRGPVKPRKVIDLDDDGSDELWMPADDTHKRKKMRKALDTERNREEEAEVEAEIEDLGYEEEQEEDQEVVLLEGSSDDEEDNTLSQKPPEEQQEIIEEIEDLEKAVPQLSEDYKLLDRLGTGTFSSVYKALDLHYHDKWYNIPWHGHHHTSSSAHYQSAPRPSGSKVYVAVKRIYVTSSPERIRNEISILDECRSCRHVSPLITAFRQDDQVVIVMPYQKNDDFREYFCSLPMKGIKAYMRCLFRALRDIHSRRIIHRDVKPANFLFDPRTGIGTLCDFGLACRMDQGPQSNRCLHSPPTAEYPHGKPKHRTEYDEETYKQMGREARKKSSRPSEEVGYLEKDTRPQSKANRAGTRGFRAPEVLLKCGDQSGAVDVWSAGMILLFFLTKKFPLFQSNDDVEALMEIATIIGRKSMEEAACLHSRTFATNVPTVKPEGISWSHFVEKQNPNIRVVPEPDVRFYPYTKQLKERAKRQLQELEFPQFNDADPDEIPQHNNYRHTPIPSSSPSHLSISTRLANDPSSASSLAFPSSPPKSTELDEMSPLTPIEDDNDLEEPPTLSLCLKGPSQEQHDADVANALELVEKLLHPRSTKRITPRDALYHPFLHTYSGSSSTRGRRRREADPMIDEDTDMEPAGYAEDDAETEIEPEDDESFPHPFGEGVCSKWHFRDDVTEEPCVYIYPQDDDEEAYFATGLGAGDDDARKQMVVRRLTSGEGIAIGSLPCEFHRIGYELDMRL